MPMIVSPVSTVYWLISNRGRAGRVVCICARRVMPWVNAASMGGASKTGGATVGVTVGRAAAIAAPEERWSSTLPFR